MVEAVYVMCAFLSIVCAVLLFRGYWKSRSQLLLWSSLCFILLAVNNGVLFFDMLIIPEIDINGQLWRNMLSAGAGALLLFGLIKEVA